LGGGNKKVSKPWHPLHSVEPDALRHVLPNTLRTCRFHRKNRPTSPSDLEDFDVVLTTYSTLSSALKSQESILHQVDWYRVVLDEGRRLPRPR
jgi:SNF2 family DNA or RNA helicase